MWFGSLGCSRGESGRGCRRQRQAALRGDRGTSAPMGCLVGCSRPEAGSAWSLSRGGRPAGGDRAHGVPCPRRSPRGQGGAAWPVFSEESLGGSPGAAFHAGGQAGASSPGWEWGALPSGTLAPRISRRANAPRRFGEAAAGAASLVSVFAPLRPEDGEPHLCPGITCRGRAGCPGREALPGRIVFVRFEGKEKK